MSTKQKIAILAGLGLIGWWYFKGRTSGDGQAAGADPLSSATGLLASLTAGKAQSNPLSDFKGFLDMTNTVATQKKPVPPADSWVWTDKSGSGWKVKPIEEFESWFSRWGDSKCKDNSGNSVPCDSVGEPCIRGLNCLPSDPGYQA